jgi:hypothetical protein
VRAQSRASAREFELSLVTGRCHGSLLSNIDMDDSGKGASYLALLIHAVVVLVTTAAFIGVAWAIAWQVLRRQRTVRELLGLDGEEAHPHSR